MKWKRKIRVVLLLFVTVFVILLLRKEDFCGVPVRINMFHGDWTHIWYI